MTEESTPPRRRRAPPRARTKAAVPGEEATPVLSEPEATSETEVAGPDVFATAAPEADTVQAVTLAVEAVDAAPSEEFGAIAVVSGDLLATDVPPEVAETTPGTPSDPTVVGSPIVEQAIGQPIEAATKDTWPAQGGASQVEVATAAEVPPAGPPAVDVPPMEPPPALIPVAEPEPVTPVATMPRARFGGFDSPPPPMPARAVESAPVAVAEVAPSAEVAGPTSVASGDSGSSDLLAPAVETALLEAEAVPSDFVDAVEAPELAEGTGAVGEPAVDAPAGVENVAPPAEETQGEAVAESASAEESAEPVAAPRSRRSRSRSRRSAAATEAAAAEAAAASEDPGELATEPSLSVVAADTPVDQELAAAESETANDNVTTGEVTESEGEAAPSTRRRRGSRARVPESGIAVHVSVPRGMGRRVNSQLIEQVVREALRREPWELASTLEVHIIDDAEMQEINVSRRGVDEVTDVLSFPLLDVRPGAGLTQDFFVLPPDASVHLGDVVISLPRVEAQADEAGHSRDRELAFLTVHGVLHLLGYDHENDDERRQMRRREEEVLSELGLRRNGS